MEVNASIDAYDLLSIIGSLYIIYMCICLISSHYWSLTLRPWMPEIWYHVQASATCAELTSSTNQNPVDVSSLSRGPTPPIPPAASQPWSVSSKWRSEGKMISGEMSKYYRPTNNTCKSFNFTLKHTWRSCISWLPEKKPPKLGNSLLSLL